MDWKKKEPVEEDSWWSLFFSLNPSMIGIIELIGALDTLYKKASPLSSGYLIPFSWLTINEIMGLEDSFRE